MPAIVKRDFPSSISFATGAYTAVMRGFAALASRRGSATRWDLGQLAACDRILGVTGSAVCSALGVVGEGAAAAGPRTCAPECRALDVAVS